MDDVQQGIGACVTVDRDKVAGGIPIFYAEDEEELQHIASLLANVLNAIAPDLENVVFIVVRH